MFQRSIAILLTLAAAAAAQTSSSRTFFQNSDVELLYGIDHIPTHQLGGAGVTIQGATAGAGTSFGYGYQMLRFSGASLWLQYSDTTAGPNWLGAGAAGSVKADFSSFTLGGRVMVPLTPRVSLLGALAGGAGDFHYPAFVNGAATSNETWHGVGETSAAVDIRIIRYLSIRIEARDIISARNLSESPSPNHFVALGGIAWHN